MKRLLTLTFLICIITFLPYAFTSAAPYPAGLIPCDGPECQACHLLELGQKLINWFIGIMATLAALIVAFAGFKMLTSGGNSGKVSEAKSMMTNVIIGFIILLSAWLIVDTVMKLFVDQSKLLGPWNELQCVAQPKYAWVPADGQSRGVSGTSPTPSTLPAAVAAVGAYKNQLCGIATNAGIGDQCASLQAIMTQESGGKPDARSPAGAIGLMQVMPAAARDLDPSLRGMTDAQIAQKLLDPTYNMQVAVAYYSKVASQVGPTNYDSIYAAYNGGLGALQPSRDCPGMQRWQCQWDDAAHTIPNTGYRETRDYVAKVNAYRLNYAKP